MNEQSNVTTPFAAINRAATITGLSAFYLRQGCQRGIIPHIKSGNKYLINIPRLLEMLNAQTETEAENK
ncbi:MAG: helix-turn-helix domain-containing protein [Oscillospiraceae bacterium]|nr:helix-turn-helix domain-containing protein [Oscillospiraceae bacterium]